MKFSDMIGPDDESSPVDAGVATDRGTPPVPPAIPPVTGSATLPETPVRLSRERSPLEEAVAGLTRVTDAPAAEPPRASGAPAGVPPLPPAPPLPEAPEPTTEAVTDGSVDAAAGTDPVPPADPPASEPSGPATVTGPPTGGSVPAEVATDAEPVAATTPPPEVPRPAIASAFATIATATAPETPTAATPETPVDAPPAATDDELPDLHEVMAELGPRTRAFDELTTSGAPADAESWLDGLGSIDDDLLPR